MGARQDEAYFVRVGEGTTMTEEDIRQNRLIVEVGLAVLRPVEFITLVFTQQMSA